MRHCEFQSEGTQPCIGTKRSAATGGLPRSFLARNDGSFWLMLVFLFCASVAAAQDSHYSQYFNVPLSVNPALTGKMDGTFRVGIDYRNQWFGLTGDGSTYSTPSFFGDVPIRFKNKDILGVGLNIVNDRSSGGRLSNFSGVFSLAYHKALGQSRDHYLSLGFQGGILQKKLDLANIRLADQIFLQDESISTGSRDQLKGSDGGFDLNAGFDWSSRFSDHVTINAGYAAMHLLQPKISFAVTETKLPIRHVAQLGADFSFSKKFGLLPFAMYMTQAKSTEIYAGLSADIGFGEEVAMYLGGYYRVDDAIVPYFGMKIKGLKIGVSYDVTASDLRNTNGGIEVSIVYLGKYVAVPDVKPSLYCPRF